MPYAGFDRSDYPGDASMFSLLNQSNLSWCGFYLAPAPSHSNTAWMHRYMTLKTQGWGFAPIYVGQQQDGPGSKSPSTERGQTDAQDAVRLLDVAGFPQQTRVFLDIETGGPLSGNMIDYYAAWVAGIVAEGVLPGVYCSYRVAPALAAIDSRPRFWVWRLGTVAPTADPPFPAPDPATSGYADARSWQYAQNVSIDTPVSLAPTDLNSATDADPSAP